MLMDIRGNSTVSNWLEMLFCCPGFHALFLHKVAHKLHSLDIPVIPRLVSHFGRFLTGIEIHPGAKIAKRVFINHGMGVVIGETTVIGDNVTIYQGVTLGGTGKETGKRHPTIGNNVVIGAGAKVLGSINIGDNVEIIAGSIVLRDIPANRTVLGIPGRTIFRKQDTLESLQHEVIPDLEAQVIQVLFNRIKDLEREIEQLQQGFSSAESYLTPNNKQKSVFSDAANLLIEEFLDGAGI
ncbi:serine O-acetyltransferase [Calothrix sp. NIES-4101]|nr:serine O-acetyltransferase [Calothrix sp. NIES-4101]